MDFFFIRLFDDLKKTTFCFFSIFEIQLLRLKMTLCHILSVTEGLGKYLNETELLRRRHVFFSRIQGPWVLVLSEDLFSAWS